ncbi:hypothetical protein FQB35_08705 [Crassaminicella thermophila]|uniref:Uncharacterized protein n=1 Tax=Crassaminicella thermophila TaxID=2599308 RepID=A0A5C0SE71_CRATE|nr:hypothetical protein [Crassaminicella thermophila]QEK12450.1 hypothetical protein FQB35_08705 [Crassaminicella thermophila]
MKYKKGNFCIEHDFEIRTVREDKYDIDLFIPIEDRTLNLYLDHEIDYLDTRLQFSMVKGIIIRFCTLGEHNTCTIHLLRNIDIHSAIVNFEMDYSKHFIVIKDKKYFVEMRFMNKIYE